eukprot:1894205-Pyramimonas_sp.AAC.1
MQRMTHSQATNATYAAHTKHSIQLAQHMPTTNTVNTADATTTHNAYQLTQQLQQRIHMYSMCTAEQPRKAANPATTTQRLKLMQHVQTSTVYERT